MFQNKCYSGIASLLRELSDAGYKLFVATSKPHVFAKQIVQHFELDSYFAKVYGPELDGTRANKDELIDYILRSEDLDATTTLMIGDRKHDILGANKHSLTTIGVLWGFGAREELELSKASYLASSPEDILSIVQTIELS